MRSQSFSNTYALVFFFLNDHINTFFSKIKLYTYMNNFLKAAAGPPLALIMFNPVINLLNGKILFILTKMKQYNKTNK